MTIGLKFAELCPFFLLLLGRIVSSSARGKLKELQLGTRTTARDLGKQIYGDFAIYQFFINS